MLTRVHIENFRGFDNFDLQLGPKHLIMGPSGSGKTTLFDVIALLLDFVGRGFVADDVFGLKNWTRWLSLEHQTFELEMSLNKSVYLYKLIIGGPKERPHVVVEHLQMDGKNLFLFTKGEVRLYDDNHEPTFAYGFDSRRSGLQTVNPTPENKKLTAFRNWFGRICCLRADPRVMSERAEKEELSLETDGSNFAAFYRSRAQEDAAGFAALQVALKDVIDRLVSLDALSAGQNVRILTAKMKRMVPQAGARSEFDLSLLELSDGEKQLIFLYFVATCIAPSASMVFLDEPDNYLPLAEIQPWLNTIEEAVEKNGTQLLLISHHPELLDQWATAYGIRFDRDEKGAVIASPFSGHSENGALIPSELIARGWDHE
jgi:ABC-type lipoprotein export system ATPase subunit